MALLNNASIVILASNYNPSIISKEWLYQRGIFTEPVDNFIHTPVLALVENSNFGFVVDEQKLQIIIKKVTQDNLTNSNAIARKFVDVLPETHYKAVGLNFQYTLADKVCDLNTLLAPKPTKLKSVFSNNYQLGAMIVFSFEPFVSTFTFTPSLIKDKPIRISLNFHAKVVNTEEVRARIDLQAKAVKKAESIIKELCKND